MSSSGDSEATRVSARWRIVGWIVLTTALALLAVTVTMRSILMSQVAEGADAQILQETEEFRIYALEGVDPATGQPFATTKALVEHYLSRQTPSTGEAIIGVVGETVLFTDNTKADAGELLANDRSRLDEILDAHAASGVATTDQGELRWGKVTVRSTQPGMPPGTVVIAHFTDFAQERVDQEATLLFGVALGGLLLTAGIAWLAAGRILRPLRHMYEAAESITARDLTARLPVSGRDDISDLAVTLNHMLDRIERAHASQRHFVAEAQQHLAGPLRRAAEALAVISEVSTDDRFLSVAAYVGEQMRYMRGTLEDLDVLALSDRPDFVHAHRVSLKEITADIYTEAASRYRDYHWHLEATASGHGWLDAARVLDAMRQLLDNAVSHSDPNDSIQIGSARDGDVARFWVTNHGPQLHQEQAEALFEVYRTEDHVEDDAGMGLGLAVVRAVADAHGGSAWVVSGGGGTQFGIDLPLSLLAPDESGDGELDGEELS